MAISDKLTKLKTDITNAYNSVQEKGGTVPSNKNTENLSSSISSIKSYENDYIKMISSRQSYYNPANLPAEITKIDKYAFAGCKNLALTSLPNNISHIDSYAFYNCTSLALTSLPENLVYINNSTFYGCTSLAITELPISCTKIYYNGLYGCTGITELTLHENFTMLSDLRNCSNLTTLKLLSSTPPELVNGNAFDGCTKLTRIEVPSASLETYKTAQKWSNYADIMVGV